MHCLLGTASDLRRHRRLRCLGISVTTLGNVGPAFGIAGATCTFAGLSDFSKSILCIEMLMGRLELFTLLVMLSPEFWKIRNRW